MSFLLCEQINTIEYYNQNKMKVSENQLNQVKTETKLKEIILRNQEK